MTRKAWKLIGSSILLAAGAVVSASAASAQTTVLRAEIPFAFYAGNETLPAGSYRVEIDRMTSRVVLIGASRQMYLVPPVHDADRSVEGQSGLRFRKYGGDYFLGQVLGRPGIGHYEWPPSSVERALAKRAGLQIARVDLSK